MAMKARVVIFLEHLQGVAICIRFYACVTRGRQLALPPVVE